MRASLNVSIIIVRCNTIDMLKNSIASITRQTAGIGREIILFGSASWDGSQTMVKNASPGAEFIGNRGKAL